VQAEGCTFYDLFTQVVQYGSWSQFNIYDGNQQRYNEAVDSLQNLCNIEPGQTLSFCNTPFTILLLNSRLIMCYPPPVVVRSIVISASVSLFVCHV